MLQAPTTNVIISVKTKYTAAISKIMRLAAIQNISSVDPADVVNIVGTVESIPKSLPKLRDFEGFSTKDLHVGDTVIFSYKVICDMLATETDDPKYKNRIWHNGKEFFAADIRKIFGIIRGDEIVMINGYVMATEFYESKIILPQHMRRMKQAAKSQVMHIGLPKENAKPINVFKGDYVYFNPFVAQKYQINDKKFIIIGQHHIFGKDVAD